MTHLLPVISGVLQVAVIVAGLRLLLAVVRCAYRHHTSGNHVHPDPFPLHYALLVAVIEVVIDRPWQWHHSRMQVVRRCDAQRAAAVNAAILRHPSTYGAARHAA